MNVGWTPTALRDLESLREYMAEDNPPAVAATVERILSGIEALSRHPDMGRKGRVPDYARINYFSVHCCAPDKGDGA